LWPPGLTTLKFAKFATKAQPAKTSLRPQSYCDQLQISQGYPEPTVLPPLRISAEAPGWLSRNKRNMLLRTHHYNPGETTSAPTRPLLLPPLGPPPKVLPVQLPPKTLVPVLTCANQFSLSPLVQLLPYDPFEASRNTYTPKSSCRNNEPKPSSHQQKNPNSTTPSFHER
jgi:hypothetical protein